MNDNNKQTDSVIKITVPVFENAEDKKKKEKKGLPPWLLGGENASSAAGVGVRGGAAQEGGFFSRLFSSFGKGGRGLSGGAAGAEDLAAGSRLATGARGLGGAAGEGGGFFSRLFSSLFGGGRGAAGVRGLAGAGSRGSGLFGAFGAGGGLLGGKIGALAAMALLAAGVAGAGLLLAKSGWFGKNEEAVGRSGLVSMNTSQPYIPEVDRMANNKSSLQMLSDRNFAVDGDERKESNLDDEEMPEIADEAKAAGKPAGSAGDAGPASLPRLNDVLSGSKYSYLGGSGSGGSTGGMGGGTGSIGNSSRGAGWSGDSGSAALPGSAGLSTGGLSLGKVSGLRKASRFSAAALSGDSRGSSGKAHSQAAAINKGMTAAVLDSENEQDRRSGSDSAWSGDPQKPGSETPIVTPSGGTTSGGSGATGNTTSVTTVNTTSVVTVNTTSILTSVVTSNVTSRTTDLNTDTTTCIDEYGKAKEDCSTNIIPEEKEAAVQANVQLERLINWACGFMILACALLLAALVCVIPWLVIALRAAAFALCMGAAYIGNQIINEQGQLVVGTFIRDGAIGLSLAALCPIAWPVVALAIGGAILGATGFLLTSGAGGSTCTEKLDSLGINGNATPASTTPVDFTSNSSVMSVMKTDGSDSTTG
ncbi:MAG: hypothetical protein PHW69_02495 [Elusimicrobiaceae bacterium]|nr:hypothetical protein [Elusimicrobiaceae bacterium]